MRPAEGLGSSQPAAGLGLRHLHRQRHLGRQDPPGSCLRQYRDEFVGNAKAVVVGMTSYGFTLADPKCLGTATTRHLDVVGFDNSVPAVISDFVRAA